MPSEVIGRGKSTEEAIANALKELGAKREEVEVMPLQSARRGFLGIFGGQDAEVRVRLRAEKRKGDAREERRERPARPSNEKQAPAQAERRNAQPERQAPPRREPMPVREKAPAREPSPARETFERRGPPTDNKDLHEVTVQILKLMDVEGEVSIQEEGSTTRVLIKGAGGILIGRRGQTLNALQYLLGRIMSDSLPEKQKVVVDIDDYRERREDNLVSLARETAQKALATGREQVLAPMDARDRRVIHLCLREIRGVETVSRGTGNLKRVVVVPKDGRRQRDNRDRGRGRRPRRGFHGRPRGDRDRRPDDRPRPAVNGGESPNPAPQAQPSREETAPPQEG